MGPKSPGSARCADKPTTLATQGAPGSSLAQFFAKRSCLSTEKNRGRPSSVYRTYATFSTDVPARSSSATAMSKWPVEGVRQLALAQDIA